MFPKKTKRKLRKSNKEFSRGLAIPFVLVFGAILAMILTSLMGYVAYRYDQSVRQIAKSNSLQAAEAGLNYYYWYVLHTLEGKTSAQTDAYWANTPLGIPSYQGSLKNQSGTVIAYYKIEVTPPARGSTVILVKITGWDANFPDLRREIDARLRKPSWSEYTVIANDIMRFGEGTEIWGPIFSNNGVHFDGVAHNLVSSNIPTTYYDPDYSAYKPGVWTSKPDESQVFLAGKLFPTPLKDFNKIAVDFGTTKLSSNPSQGGFYLAKLSKSSDCGYHIILETTNKFKVYKVTSCNSVYFNINKETYVNEYTMPSNGLIFIEDHLWIEGAISNKHLTVVAADTSGADPANIYLFKDINYTYDDGRDVLGLVAQNNITVTLNSNNVLNIHAALIAQSGRIGRDYYTSSDSSTYYKRNTINVTGALATNRRYGFAWTCGAGTYCSGYNIRNIIYDNNLLYYPPPFFPTGDHYSLDLWEEK